MMKEQIDFKKHEGLVPCIIQDHHTEAVLMCGYMNAAALAKTESSGKVTFFSRSKQRLWMKGETTGNFLNVISICADCDYDALLIRVKPEGPVCHTGAYSCFGDLASGQEIINLEQVIKNKKSLPDPNSYTRKLFDSGINKIAQKVGEEAVELIIEAKDDNRERFLNEAADLLYHYLVLLQAKGFMMKDVEQVLRERRK